MSNSIKLLGELTSRALKNQHGAYLDALSEAYEDGASAEEAFDAHALSGTSPDFDARGDVLDRGLERKAPIFNTDEFPESRTGILSNLSYLAMHDEYEGYVDHLVEAQNRLIPDIEIYIAHQRGVLEASFNYLGERL